MKRNTVIALLAAVALGLTASPAHASYAYYDQAVNTCQYGHIVFAAAWFSQNGYPGSTWATHPGAGQPYSYYRFADGSIDVSVDYWRGYFPSSIYGRATEVCHVVNTNGSYGIVNWSWPYLGGYVVGTIPWSPIY